MKTFLISLGWLEIWVQLRLGRPAAHPMRRYLPAPRRRIDQIRGTILHRLGDCLSHDRSP